MTGVTFQCPHKRSLHYGKHSAEFHLYYLSISVIFLNFFFLSVAFCFDLQAIYNKISSLEFTWVWTVNIIFSWYLDSRLVKATLSVWITFSFRCNVCIFGINSQWRANRNKIEKQIYWKRYTWASWASCRFAWTEMASINQIWQHSKWHFLIVERFYRLPRESFPKCVIAH